MEEYLTRKNAIRVLLLAIIFVVLRIIWNVNHCVSSGGTWNPKSEVCEQDIKPLPKKEEAPVKKQ